MIGRSAAVACLIASLAGIASALNLLQIGVESTRAGAEASFGYLLLSSAFLQGVISILLLLYRNFATSLMFLLVSVVPGSLEIAQPVPVRSIWDVISTIAAFLGVLALILIAIKNVVTKLHPAE